MIVKVGYYDPTAAAPYGSTVEVMKVGLVNTDHVIAVRDVETVRFGKLLRMTLVDGSTLDCTASIDELTLQLSTKP